MTAASTITWKPRANTGKGRHKIEASKKAAALLYFQKISKQILSSNYSFFNVKNNKRRLFFFGKSFLSV